MMRETPRLCREYLLDALEFHAEYENVGSRLDVRKTRICRRDADVTVVWVATVGKGGACGCQCHTDCARACDHALCDTRQAYRAI